MEPVRRLMKLNSHINVDMNSPVCVAVEPGSIIVQTAYEKVSLVFMLTSSDPKRHGCEAMAFAPLGKETMSQGLIQ
jgi:hypothetical protein